MNLFVRRACAAPRRALLLLMLSAPALPVFAAEAPLWRDVDESGLTRTSVPRQIVPEHYRTVRLDRRVFDKQMQQVPQERTTRVAASDQILELPDPDGGTARFRIVESSVLAPELAKRYPVLRTWVGQGIDDPAATLRLDFTSKGLHAQILSPEGTRYIDPYQPGDTDTYISYFKRDHHAGKQMRCEVTGEPIDEEALGEHLQHAMPSVSAGTQLRTYRLAVAATGEYTSFHGGTVLDGLSGIVTTINRVTGIYEREVAVRFQLVADNDRLVYVDAGNDPFSNTSSDLNSVTSTINGVIGSGNYDVGHLVGTGGGGVAGLGVICGSSKGRGLTGSSAPIGDGFDVDYVAHEMGHQFGGNHTFNGSGNNCSGGNRNGSTAYEPGSGVTIQAYAGICGADNLQPNSEDFFHRVSLNEIIAHTTTGSGGNCGTLTSTGNHVPTVTVPAQMQIPVRTPFELEAVGTDADGDVLTYAWEQFDLGAANTAGTLEDNGTRALFRAFAPGVSPVRVFPSLRYILGNANVVPATAPLPGTTSPAWFTGELLPTTTRNLNFRVTVRDNRAGGGGTNEASTLLKVNAAAGPFVITAPNTAVSWSAGSSQALSWDVAGTDAAPVSASQVQILLSLDGGYTWPVVLAAAEANDGSANVIVPAGTPSTSRARIKIKAVGNVFFDISDVDFSITGSNTPPTVTVSGDLSVRQGSPAVTAAVGGASDAQDAAASLLVAVGDAPEDLATVVENQAGTLRLTVAAACTLVAPTSGTRVYPVRLDVTDSGGATTPAFVNVAVAANQAPTLGVYADTAVARGQSVTVTPSAPLVDPNDNFAGVSVTPQVLPGGGSVSVASNGAVTVVAGTSTAFDDYTIEVRGEDSCGATVIRRFTLGVAPSAAVLEVAGLAVDTGNGIVEPGECNALSLSLRNVGTVTATAVVADLAIASPGASLVSSSIVFPDIPAGETRVGSGTVDLGTEAGLACFSALPLDVSVSYGGGEGGPLQDTLSLDVGQAAAGNYTFTATADAVIPAGGTLISGSSADDAVVSLAVPFAFSLFDASYPANTALRASTNGTLQVASSGGSAAYDNAALPATGSYSGTNFPAGAPMLAPFWDDLRLDTSGGGITTVVQGSAPDRRFYIVWRGQPYSSSVTGTNTVFAVVLRENSAAFDFIYEAVAAGTASANGASATIGIQAASSGGLFTQYAFNAAAVTPGTRLAAARPVGVCEVGSGTCAVEDVALFKDGFEDVPTFALKRR